MSLKEEEIRPEKIFDEYLRLVKKDIKKLFNNVKLKEFLCPCCNLPGNYWATKDGFTYKKCNKCSSIFLSPRPEAKVIENYYKDSESTKFWATTFYKLTEGARREKLWKPKAVLIKNLLTEKNHPKYIIDIGGGYGVFDEEITKIMDCKPIIIEPSIYLSEICKKKGFTVIEKFIDKIEKDELPGEKKCFVSFELFEHLHDPKQFLIDIYNLMSEGDSFIFTTLSGMGIDIQLLKENSKSLSPPHHLNFLNPKSVKEILSNIGYKGINAFTPGKLDIDILFKNRKLIKDDYWVSLMDYLNKNELERIQEMVSKLGVSSHMMISCKK